MYKCEICGKEAEKHHIVHSSEGGLNFPLNYKYLCAEHHRGKNGPHRNKKIDIKYKIQLQKKLEILFTKEFYTTNEISRILNMSKAAVKKVFKKYTLYKEGYKKRDIIFRLMGEKKYDEETLYELEIKNLVSNF